MSNPWFRVYTEMVDDEKIRLLAFEDRWHYVAILCCKGKGILDASSDLPMTMRKLSVKLGLTVRELETVLSRLSEVGLVDAETGQPTGWDSRQFVSDTSTERVRAYRERMKRSGNVAVTAQDTDTDTDTEAKTSIKPRKRGKRSKVSMPEGFGISDQVRAWAAEKGYQRLTEHLDSFKRKCAANGYRYVDWDAAFMEAIRGDWAKLNNHGNGNGAVAPSAVQTKTVKEAMKPTETGLERDIARARHDCHLGMIDAAERDRRIHEATSKHRATGEG